MSHPLKAIIVGSGVAGLASAIRLAIQGFDVTVYEKNDYPGGKLSELNLNGFHFDTGPSLFVQPQNIEELFELAGENILEYFQYSSLPLTCKYFYEDGIEINAWSDTEKFGQELSLKVGENPDKLKYYLHQSSRLYNNIGSIFLNHPLQKRRTAFRANIFKAVTSVRWKYFFNTLYEVNKSSFTRHHTIQLFNRYATYNGSSPYKIPGLFSLITHTEFNEGAFFPKGGMINIMKALYTLALKKGVKFQFNAPVQRIIHNDGEIKGIVVNNENIYTNVVVSNTDILFTYKYLLRDEITAKKLQKKERSSSAVTFYWCIGKEIPQLELHNIFFSKDYKAEFDHIFRFNKLYNDPTVYINITSKCDKAHAPAGKENWFVMVNVPAGSIKDRNTYIQQCKTNVITKLNRMLKTNIESLLDAEEVLDPKSLEERTGAYLGAIYGASSNSRRAAFFRHPNFSKHIQGLYFVGGTVHPGGGIPLCLKSAKIMSDIIEKDKRHFSHH